MGGDSMHPIGDPFYESQMVRALSPIPRDVMLARLRPDHS